LEVLDGHFIFLYQLGSPEILKTSFHVELDVAKATWLSHDIVMFSSKNGEILLLTVVYDGRYGTIITHCSFEKAILSLYKCFRLHIDYYYLIFLFTELCKD